MMRKEISERIDKLEEAIFDREEAIADLMSLIDHLIPYIDMDSIKDEKTLKNLKYVLDGGFEKLYKNGDDI